MRRLPGSAWCATRSNPTVNSAAWIDLDAAEARYAAMLAGGQLPNLRQMKRELRLGQEDRPRLVLAHLAQVQARSVPAPLRTGGPQAI